jgi:hypothetical protein
MRKIKVCAASFRRVRKGLCGAPGGGAGASPGSIGPAVGFAIVLAIVLD